jgi:putative FmdB family regulatory protein
VPTYDYRCRSCGNVTEVIHSMLEDGPTVCERCGGVLRRVLFPSGIIFKGSGFYRNDSRAARAGSEGGSEKSAGSSASDATSGTTKSENSEKSEKSEGSEKSEKSEKSEGSEKSEKSDTASAAIQAGSD